MTAPYTSDKEAPVAEIPSIRCDNLVKHYRVHHKEAGLRGSLRTLVNRRYESVPAVDGVSCTIAQGEIVGFLGPNGAGKTTLLKCLSGLLYPTAGQVSVHGYTPHHREKGFLKSITLVMGQRNGLLWDLPAMETFLVNQTIYNVPQRQFRETLDELVALLDLQPLLHKQVRKLSLGERMRCELAGALLHRPQVLFLDEPTIGLDVTAQAAIRDFIRAYNQRHRATVLLTSHYMADVTALASRVLVIGHGQLIYDGDLRALVESTAPYKLLRVTLQRPVAAHDLLSLGDVAALDGLKATLRIPRGEATERAGLALARLPIVDMTIEDPPIEEIVSEIFQRGVQQHA